MTVKQVQSLLTYLGYAPGDVDGISGVKTIAAIETFQSSEGLSVDGIVGSSTEAALLEAVANGRFKSDTSETASSSSENPNNSNVSENPTGSGTFWDGIKYFTRSEFRCQCGGKYCDGFPAEPAEALVAVAERVREHFGQPVTVSSGLRCTKHNAEVGGVANSRHIIGHAMDYCVKGQTAAAVLAYAKAQPEIVYAYAINDSYVHMDIGS